MACLIEKTFRLWEQYFEKLNYIILIMGLFILHYGLMFTHMACLMGIIIRLWYKYFEVGILLFWLWAYIIYIMDLWFSHDGLSNGNNNSILG